MGGLEQPQHSPDTAELLAAIPPMPAIAPNSPLTVSRLFSHGDGRYWIGCQRLPGKKGGTSFVVVRRSDLKVVKSLPSTEDGWVQAWQAFVELDADSARQVIIAERASTENVPPELARLRAESLNHVAGVIYLGGYTPETELVVGKFYDLWFLKDRLTIVSRYNFDILVTVPYTNLETVEIGGPGLIKSGGGFSGGSVSGSSNIIEATVGAVSSKAIASALNSLTTKTSIRTILRIQGDTCEIFLLHKMVVPDDMRMGLSRSLGAIRRAQKVSPEIAESPDTGQRLTDKIDALSKAASMLDRGLLTRDEFDSLKAKIISES